MNAAHIMTTGVITIQKGNSVKEAMKVLIENRIRQMPILDEEKRIIGVLKTRKLFQSILPKYVTDGLLKDIKFAPDLPQFYEKAEGLADKDVMDVIDKNFIKISPETSVFEIATIFANAEHPVECIYIVDYKDRPLGIISPWDIFKKIWDACNE